MKGLSASAAHRSLRFERGRSDYYVGVFLSIGSAYVSDELLRDRTCLVTGANRGVGFATARRLARLGARVVLIGRNEARLHNAANRIRPHAVVEPERCVVDLASQASIRAGAAEMVSRFPRIDVLLHNAAWASGRRRLTEDGIELQLAINHVAPFLLTSLLWKILVVSAPARIVVVASEAHRKGHLNVEDLAFERGYSRFRAYSRTKLANILFVRALARRLPPGVTCNAVHPGVVATGLLGGFALIPQALSNYLRFVPTIRSIDEGAETPVFLASSAEVEGISGGYFMDNVRIQPSADARDDQLGAALWHATDQMVGGTMWP